MQDAPRPRLPTSIEIHGAREHNLKNVDVNLGLNRFTVITGVSGSGKSTLAFDILFAEGQRRYLESLNAYARQFVQPASRPDVDAIFGIPPTVAIEQRTSRGGHKSTVATLTEIYHFLRLLYVKLGVQYCPVCEARIEPQSADAIAARLLKDYRGKSITLLAPLIVARKGLYTALAKWARGKGFAHLRVDGKLLPTAKWPRLDRFIEHNIELPVATLTVSAGARSRTAAGTGRGIGARTRRGARRCVGRQDQGRRRQPAHRPASSPPSAPAPTAAPAFPNSIRACSRSTRSTAGARAASAPDCNWRSSTPNKAARNPHGGRRTARKPTDGRPVACRRMRGPTPQSRRAARAVSRPIHRRAHRFAGAGFLRELCKSSNWSAASATSRATCWRNSPRAPPFSAMSAWAICN